MYSNGRRQLDCARLQIGRSCSVNGVNTISTEFADVYVSVCQTARNGAW